MSEIYTYPGIYLTETADIPRTVTAATTSLTAIMGLFPRGPIDQAVLVSSQADFEAQFAGDTIEGLATYAVQQFFLNGGSGAWIVRLAATDSTAATVNLSGITITASSPGSWANGYAVALTDSTLPLAPTAPKYLDFTLYKGTPSPSGPPAPILEQIPNLPASDPAQLAALITAASQYVVAVTPQPPPSSVTANPTPVALAGGFDGTWNDSVFKDAVNGQLNGPVTQGGQGGSSTTPGGQASGSTGTGGQASGSTGKGGQASGSSPSSAAPSGTPAQQPTSPLLDLIAPQVFNLLCIPDLVWMDLQDQTATVQVAHKYAADHQAFLLVDPPPPEAGMGAKPTWMTSTVASVNTVGVGTVGLNALAQDWGHLVLDATRDAGAVYYPWLLIPDPASSGAQLYVPPSGTVAGIYAATDASRGVWKAPAGVDASLTNVTGLADVSINDTINGTLNVLGINAIRTFPIYGTVVWGSRTLAGSDLADSAWKYVPVRRLTDFIEQSLLQSLRWAIFEPNGPSLWSSISLEIGAFMSGLYAAGAFSGATAAQAYQVVCDATTTSETDMLSGIVRVHVGFQPVEPAEFVVLNIVLNAGSAAS
jgi:phage tail sheath protein FI